MLLCQIYLVLYCNVFIINPPHTSSIQKIIWVNDFYKKYNNCEDNREESPLKRSCNYDNEIFYGNQDGKGAGHMNSYDNWKLAKNAGVKHLVLTHLPHYGELDQLVSEASSEFEGRVSLAKEGLELTL